MEFDNKDFEDVVSEKKTEEPKKKKAPDTLFQKIQDEPVKTIRQLVAVTESAMAERVQVWDRYRRKYRRGLYYLKNTSGVPLYFTNYLFANVESIKANITRNLPKLSASPRGSRDDLASDLLSRALEDTLGRGGIKKATKEVVHHGLLATLAYYKVYYSDLIDNVVVEAITPENMLVDPKASTLDDARWIIHRRKNVPVDEIYATYGEVPEQFADRDSDSMKSDDRMAERDGLYTSTGEMRPAIEVAPTFDVYEAWLRVWEKDAENPWYVVTIAGSTVLKSEYSVYEHKSSPFVVWFGGEDFGGDNIYYRGVGAIEEIEPLQDRADAIDLKIYKHISLMTNRQKFVSAQSGLNVSAMDNTSGRTLKVNGAPRDAVYYDVPPQLPMEVYNYRDRTEMLMQTVSGVFDVTQGRRPTGITAGRAIESLKDSAETRLADLADTLASSLEEVGNKAIQIMLQFFDGERLIKSTDGDKDKDFLILAEYPPELQPQPMPMLGDMGEMLIDEETGGYQIDEEDDLSVDKQLEMQREEWKQANGVALVLEDISYIWDIRANADSALPSAKAERAQVATEMFRLGAIDREALLMAIEYPERHKILQRLAKQVTGQNAGDPNAEGDPMAKMMAMLQEMGLPQEVMDALMEQMQAQQSGAGGPQTGQFKPQMTM